MWRKSVYLEPDQERRLKELAERRGVSEAEVILSETHSWLRYRDRRTAATRLHTQVEAGQRTGLLTIRWVDRSIHARAREIFERYDDQAFSFCDCTSFIVAREERADYVFGFDRDLLTMGIDPRP